jgi:hypothetical protein
MNYAEAIGGALRPGEQKNALEQGVTPAAGGNVDQK